MNTAPYMGHGIFLSTDVEREKKIWRRERKKDSILCLGFVFFFRPHCQQQDLQYLIHHAFEHRNP